MAQQTMANRPECLVARNPNPASRLPYLLRLPVAGQRPVFLACGDIWPAAKDVFCLELDAWPEGAETIERWPVQSCWREGKAIHLVLQRRLRRRSMFVWTQSRGRTLIFWRTQKTMRAARPGLKVPQARGLEGFLEVAVDIREQYPWRFNGHRVRCIPRELPVGDYGILVNQQLYAAVERKSVDGLATSAVDGTLSFALAELSRLPHGCLVVEGRFSQLFKRSPHVDKGWLLNVIAALQVTQPRVNWIFAETRSLAEEFAFRWLAAARKAAADPGSMLYQGVLFTGPAPAGPGAAAEPAASYGSTPTVRDRRGRFAMALQLADGGRAWTAREYADYFKVSQATAWSDLSHLVKAGSLEAQGSRRNRQYVRPARPGPGQTGN